MKSPSAYSIEISKQVVELMLPKFVSYLKKGGFTEDELNDGYLAEVRDDLIKAIEFDDDAHKICKNLEAGTWDIDDKLMSLVSVVNAKRADVYRKFVKEWVRSRCVSAKHRIGEKVVFNHQGKSENGEIASIQPEMAQYVIMCEHLGHVKGGLGSRGFYVNFEEVSCPGVPSGDKIIQ